MSGYPGRRGASCRLVVSGKAGIRMCHQTADACAQASAGLAAVCYPESGRLSINNPDTAFTHRLPSASRTSPST